ncbi:hypothetical protein [Pleionea sediminis]|uniref:hypothetical protein n=1 Tax=Pleionea sediminis TaxID=2569479 RepID=UPI001184C3DC|nr:hypothetical protein [Pleionea sediminis]
MSLSPDVAILIMSVIISLCSGILIHSFVSRYKQRKLNREFAAFHIKNLRKGKYDDEIISHALAEEIVEIIEKQNSGEGNLDQLVMEKEEVLNELYEHIVHCWEEKERLKQRRISMKSQFVDVAS